VVGALKKKQQSAMAEISGRPAPQAPQAPQAQVASAPAVQMTQMPVMPAGSMVPGGIQQPVMMGGQIPMAAMPMQGMPMAGMPMQGGVPMQQVAYGNVPMAQGQQYMNAPPSYDAPTYN